jgi:hypothetical protein
LTDINAQTPDQQARKEVDTKYSMSDYIKHENVSVTHFSTTKREELKKWLHVTFGQDQNKWICYVNSEYTDALVYEFAKPSHQTLFQLTFSEYEFYNSATSLERNENAHTARSSSTEQDAW